MNVANDDSCWCDPTHGQSCRWCDGTAAEQEAWNDALAEEDPNASALYWPVDQDGGRD